MEDRDQESRASDHAHRAEAESLRALETTPAAQPLPREGRTVFICDGGAVYCEAHLGYTARTTRHDLSGQRILEVDPVAAASNRLRCETCFPYSKEIDSLRLAIALEGLDDYLTREPEAEKAAELSCPVNDPDCLGTDEECHDACEAPDNNYDANDGTEGSG